MVSASDSGSEVPKFQLPWMRNSTRDYVAFHCTEPFIIALPSFQYDLYNERDVKYQIIIDSCISHTGPHSLHKQYIFFLWGRGMGGRLKMNITLTHLCKVCCTISLCDLSTV